MSWNPYGRQTRYTKKWLKQKIKRTLLLERWLLVCQEEPQERPQ
jgi:hypothetical protein